MRKLTAAVWIILKPYLFHILTSVVVEGFCISLFVYGGITEIYLTRSGACHVFCCMFWRPSVRLAQWPRGVAISLIVVFRFLNIYTIILLYPTLVVRFPNYSLLLLSLGAEINTVVEPSSSIDHPACYKGAYNGGGAQSLQCVPGQSIKEHQWLLNSLLDSIDTISLEMAWEEQQKYCSVCGWPASCCGRTVCSAVVLQEQITSAWPKARVIATLL